MPELVLRRALPSDASLIAAHNAALALETENKRLDPATVRRGTEAVLADSAKGFYLLAERAGEVIGQLLVTFEWSDWRNANFWWIQSVYVASAARRHGVYRALQAHLLAEARRAGNICGLRLYVERQNLPAQSTYRALGLAPAAYEMFELEL